MVGISFLASHTKPGPRSWFGHLRSGVFFALIAFFFIFKSPFGCLLSITKVRGLEGETELSEVPKGQKSPTMSCSVSIKRLKERERQRGELRMRDSALVRVEGIPAPPLTSLLLCLCDTALEHNGLFTSPSLHSPTDSQGLPGAATVQLRPPQTLLGCSDDPGLVPALELQILVKQEQLGAHASRKASKRHPLRDAGPQHLQ